MLQDARRWRPAGTPLSSSELGGALPVHEILSVIPCWMSGLSHRLIPLSAGSAPTAGAGSDYAVISPASWRAAETAASVPPPSADRSAGSSAPVLPIGRDRVTVALLCLMTAAAAL